jgi:hypothetical protein
MAPEKELTCVCDRREVFEVLKDVSEKWSGVLGTFPPVRYEPFDLLKHQHLPYDKDVSLELFIEFKILIHRKGHVPNLVETFV